MATVTINGCRPAQPPIIFRWRRPTIKTIRAKPELAPYLDRETLTAAALAYLAGGLSIIPVGPRKKPLLKWTPFQEKPATLEQIKVWARFHSLAGFAVVCGGVSGGLTIIDFDVDGFYERWAALVGELAQALPTQRTGGGGYQVAFRSILKTKNDKLAWAPANNTAGRETAIETRGEGGYAVLPPSFCHLAEKRGKRHQHPYQVLQGDFAKIPSITTEQARHLIEVARSLCQVPVSKKQMQAAPLSPRSNGGAGGSGVIGAFNAFYEVGAILSRNGYQPRGNRYLAPDSTTGEPGVYIFEDTGRCYSHHGNDPLNDGHGHNPFSVFCILEHSGDVRAAVKAAAVELGIDRTHDRPQEGAPADDGQDYNQQGRESIQEEAQELPPDWRGPQAPKTAAIKFVTGRKLQSIEFKDPAWVVPGILPEGLCLLSARPKKGKTWIALGVSSAKAAGGCALGKGELRLTQGKVLYLALEDKLRRAQKRLKIIIGDAQFPKDLILAESWPRLDKGGLKALQDFLKEYDDCKMVVIDSFVKIKPPRPKNVDPYDFDMAVGGALQSLAQERQICLLLIYHNRKSEGEDPLDDVIGSTGLTGAVDAVLILRRGRGQADATLFVTGRDVEEQELAMKFHPGEGLWELLGDAADYAKSQERLEILGIIQEHGPKTPKELSEIIGKKQNSVKGLLFKMAKDQELKSVGGRYEIIKK